MKENIKSITGFRSVAFMIIFLSHATVIWHDFGGLGVSFFLVLSGFITFYAHEKHDVKHSLKDCIMFSKNKVSRMYPLHLIMILPALLIQIVLIFFGRSQTTIIGLLQSLVPNVLLIHTWFPLNSIYFGFNGVAWYLSTYVFLCFMFPMIFNVMKRWNIKKVIVSLFICMVIPILLSSIIELADFNEYREWLLYVFPPVRLIDYFAGMQLGWLFCNKKIIINEYKIDFYQVSVIFLCVFATWFLNLNSTDSFLAVVLSESMILYLPLSLICVYLVALDRGRFDQFLHNKWLISLSKLSMYAFLIHYLVLQYVHIIISNFISQNVNSFVLFFVNTHLKSLLEFHIKLRPNFEAFILQN